MVDHSKEVHFSKNKKMIKGFLLGAVVAEKCKLPELERSDVEWDCTEKDCCWTKTHYCVASQL